MSPTVFTKDGFRFYFFSREEVRAHVTSITRKERSRWLEPVIELAQYHGLKSHRLERPLLELR